MNDRLSGHGDQQYVVGLYRLLNSGVSDEKVAEWYREGGYKKYGNTLIKRTLKMADREELIPYIIQEEDIKLGDNVKSRTTARVGEVVKIHTDGDTITVKWQSGGLQPMPKEAVYKWPKSDTYSNVDDFKKVHTQGDEYKDMINPKMYRTQRDIREE